MKMKVMMGVVALGMSFSALAARDYTPYVGVDAKWNQMELKKSAGGNLTQKNYPQGNLFGGVKFNEWFAVEAGYESTSEKKRTNTVQPGGSFLGTTNPAANPVLTSNAKTKINGFHLNIVGFYPICDENRISLFGSVGLAQLKFRSNVKYTFAGDPTVNSVDFTKRKVLPRVTLGIQHMFDDNIGVRAMLAWERTSAFKKVQAKNSILYMSPKDSKSIGLGVFYSFK